VYVDPELLLEDPQGPVSLAVELGGDVVVVENETLSGAGFGLCQIWLRRCLSSLASLAAVQRSGARRTIPSPRRA
jgi:hypothetical protein